MQNILWQWLQGFLQFLFSIPFCVHVLSSPTPGPLFIFSEIHCETTFHPPLSCQEDWIGLFFMLRDRDNKVQLWSMFFFFKKREKIIVLALQNRPKGKKTPSCYLQQQSMFNIIKGEQIVWHKSIVSYNFIAGSLKILKAPQKNSLLFFFSSRQKTPVTDM